jgi:hypothetical protein
MRAQERPTSRFTDHSYIDATSLRIQCVERVHATLDSINRTFRCDAPILCGVTDVRDVLVRAQSVWLVNAGNLVVCHKSSVYGVAIRCVFNFTPNPPIVTVS